MPARSPWTWFFWWPVRRADQMLFAEALSQCLAAGLPLRDALTAAADANANLRFRAALREMTWESQTGRGLAASLSRTGAAVGGELLAALEIGEDRGRLAEELAAFARRCDPRPGVRLAAAVGRPPEVARFAAALADLLADRRLTVWLLEDAGRLAAGAGSPFAAAVDRVAAALAEGATLAEALGREPRIFDPLFRRLVGAPDGRDGLRAVLARLGADAAP